MVARRHQDPVPDRPRPERRALLDGPRRLEPTRLTNNTADDIEAAWSPDGTRIAFQSRRSGNDDIWVMTASPLATPVNLTQHRRHRRRPGLVAPGRPDRLPGQPQRHQRPLLHERIGRRPGRLRDGRPGPLARLAAGQRPAAARARRSASPAPPPGVGSSSATVSGSVNPNGRATSVRFEYGPSTAYGLQTPDRAIGAGKADVGVSEVLKGLREGTTYHFRVVASNAIGTTRGPDQVFGTGLVAGGRHPRPDRGHPALADRARAHRPEGRPGARVPLRVRAHEVVRQADAVHADLGWRAHRRQRDDRRPDPQQALPLPPRPHRRGDDAGRR